MSLRGCLVSFVLLISVSVEAANQEKVPCKCANAAELTKKCDLDSKSKKIQNDCVEITGIDKELWKQMTEMGTTPSDQCLQVLETWKIMDIEKCWSGCLWKKLNLVDNDSNLKLREIVSYVVSSLSEKGINFMNMEALIKCLSTNATQSGEENFCRNAGATTNCVWDLAYIEPTLECWLKSCQPMNENIEMVGASEEGMKADCANNATQSSRRRGRGGRGRRMSTSTS